MAGQTTNYLFDYPTSTDYVKDGATAIETLADDVDATLFTALGGAYPGLRLVKKQTIGTGVSSVTVTGAFSATYDNYKIIMSGGSASASNDINMTLGSATTGYYSALNVVNYTTSGVAGVGRSNTAFWDSPARCNTTGNFANIDIFMPFATTTTRFNAVFENLTNAGTVVGAQASTTSFTSFTFTPSAGATMTGGTIYVYGYGIS
jgi:hypothetical protein